MALGQEASVSNTTDSALTASGDDATAERRTFEPRCVMPWQQLMIDAAGVVQPCAYRGNYTNHSPRPPLGNINEQTLEEIWNGAEAQHLRRCMADGDMEGAGCSNCLAVKQGQSLQLQYDPGYLAESGEASEYRANMQTKIAEVRDGAAIIASKPTILYYTPSHHCNLQCVHCYQNSSRSLSVSRKDASGEILALLPVLTELIAGGGEPLILPLWRRFVANYDPSRNPYLRFATTTNATILRDDMVQGLAKFRALNIIVSLDGATKDTFETIRLFSHWDQFELNVARLKDITRSRYESFFSFNISVMKGNILELPDLVRYCTAWAAGFNYQPVVAYPWKQSLRCFNDPVRETEGWAEALDEAKECLEDFFRVMEKEGAAGRITWEKYLEPIYHGHVEALRNLVPWEILALPHRRMTGRLPLHLPGLQEHLDHIVGTRGRVPVAPALGFFPVLPDGSLGEAHHYATVEPDGRFTVSLPDGQFGVGLCADDSHISTPTVAWSLLRADVANGRILLINRRRDRLVLAFKHHAPGLYRVLATVTKRLKLKDFVLRYF